MLCHVFRLWTFFQVQCYILRKNCDEVNVEIDTYIIFLLQMYTVEAASQLKNVLVMENPGNQRLRKWLGDPCTPSPWEGLDCGERNQTLIITKL